MKLNFYFTTKFLLQSLRKFLALPLFILAANFSFAQTGATALSFDGVNDYVSIPIPSIATGLSLNISGAITLEAWINPTRIGGTQDVICKSSNTYNNGYIFPRTSDGWQTIEFLVNINGFGWQTLQVPYGFDKLNQWHHLAATYDGYYMRIYIDGVLAGSNAFAGTITVNTNPLTIGGQAGFANEFFQGKVDDARVWKRALSQCEIASTMNCELNGPQSGLVAYYTFNQGLLNLANPGITQLTDASGNANNGNLINFGLLAGLISNWADGIVTGNCSVFVPTTATAGSLNPTIPVGGTIGLLASGANAGGTYSWVGPNGYTSSMQNPILTGIGLNASGTYTVTVNNAGCSASASTVVTVALPGGSLNFDGLNDYVTIPNTPSFNSTQSISIETWVNPTSASPLVQNVLSKSSSIVSNGYIFPRTDDGWRSFSFWLAIDGNWKVLSAQFPALNQWNHVAATYDGFYMKIYLNGVLSGTLAVSGTVTTNTNRVTLGQQDGKVEFYKGGIDELRVWSRALNQCEIQNNMTCELNGANNGLSTQTGLAGYYRFNQGFINADNTGFTTLADSSGNGNHGTLQSFDLVGTASNWAPGKASGTCGLFQGGQATITGNGPVLEVGSTLTLTASAGTGWTWTGPSGYTSTQQTISIPNAQTNRSGTYTVSVVSNGCTTQANANITIAYKAGSLSFDGINDMITVPRTASLDIPNTITLESWIYPTNGTRLVQDVMSKSTQALNNGFIFPRTDDAWASFVFYLHINGEWQKLASPYPALNEWHHVAATYDGFYMRIYLDGVVKASKQVVGNIDQNTNDLYLGQQPGFTEYFSGKMEELRVWNRALNQCEIINNRNCELAQSARNGLVAYYKFNQGFLNADNSSFTTLADSSANGNNGTLQNFALQGTSSNWSDFKINGTCSAYSLPPYTASSNGTVFGIGSTVKLFATGGTTYTWDGPNSFASALQNPSITNAQTTASGVYTVTLPFVNCVITSSFTLNVSALSPISASGPTTFCPSSSVTLSSPNPGIAYQWYLNAVIIPGATANTYVATQGGSYTISVNNGHDILVSAPLIITVVDNLPPQPVVGTLPTLTLATPGVITVFPTAIDNCAGTVTGTTTTASLGTYNTPGTYSITWTYDDLNGNIFQQTQQVVVVLGVDIVPPVLTVPVNITLNNVTGTCGATANFTATATDNSGLPITITYSQNPGTVFAGGTTTVTVTATDASNNSTSKTFTVTVKDVQPPTIIAPPAISAFTNAGCNATGVALGTPLATDNCTFVLIITNNAPASFPKGNTTVTWTVTDGAGLTATATQVVTVVDNVNPTITAPSPVLVSTNSGCGATGVVLGTPVTADNCAVSTITNDAPTIFPLGITTVTWTVKDNSNNVATAQQLVTVVAPEINITGNNITILKGDVTPLTADNTDFGSTLPGTAVSKMYTIQNTGSGALIISSIAISGANATDFTRSGIILPITIATNSSTTFVITFNSASAGNKNATVIINNNDCDEASYDFAVKASISCSTPVFTVAPSNISLQSGSIPVTYTVTVSATPTASVTYVLTGATIGSGAGTGSGSLLNSGITNVSITATNSCGFAIKNFTVTAREQYTIIGYKEVELGESNIVASGSVGVLSNKGEAEFKKYSSVASQGSFVKAAKIDIDRYANILQPIYAMATPSLPAMIYNTAYTKYLPNYEVKSGTVTLNGNYGNLNIKKGSVVTLTGNIFGTIHTEEGAQLIFTQSSISIDQLQIDKGTQTGYTYVRFASNTNVLISKSVSIGDKVYINPDNYKVNFYVGSQQDTKKNDDDWSDDTKFSVTGKDTRVTANIMMPSGKLQVNGGNDKSYYNNDDDDHHDNDNSKSSATSFIYMTGLFIATEVESEAKNVIWNSFDYSAPTAPVLYISSSPVVQKIVAEVTATSEEELKITVMPNPSTTYFTLKFESKYEIPVNLRVMDASGRVVDAKSKIGSNSTFQIGHNYSSGTYYAEIIQGTKRQVVQLIKVRG